MRSTTLISIPALAIASALVVGCNRDANEPAATDKAAVASDQAGAAGGLTENGREFLLAAAADGMLEVEAGKLAESRAQTEPVRQFARMMVEHHAKANEELAKLAKTSGIELPKALDEDGRDKLDELREESGRDFDEEYIDLMIDEHERVIRKFEREAERDDDPTVRGWASQTLPTLRTHLDEAKRTEDAIDDLPVNPPSQDTPTAAPPQTGAGSAAGADATKTQTPGTATKAGAGLEADDPTPGPMARPEGGEPRAPAPGAR